MQRLCGSQLDFEEMKRTDPQRYQRFVDYENLLQNQLLNSRTVPSGIITIPVVVHVVYYNSTQNITDARINEQIQVLNEDFRRLNADRTNTPAAFSSVAADVQIEFKLAKIDPNGNPTTGITRTPTPTNGFSASTNNVKSSITGGINPWNTQKYLNIWVCNLTSPSGIMGYSSSPVDFATYPNLDGVVIHYNYFGKTGTSAPYNKGRTTTHEVGHWLDLRHIWADNPSCSVDDGVADTPVQSAYTTSYHPNCPSFPRYDACTTTSPGVMFMNFMDYTDDGCMNLFTNGQKTRMRALFDNVNGIRRQIIVGTSAISNPPVITGYTPMCYGSSKTFSATNWQSGIFYWNCGGYLSPSSISSNTTTVSVTAGYVDYASYVSVINIVGVELARYNLWIGRPVMYISGPSYAIVGDQNYYLTYPTSSCAEPLSNYTWYVSPSANLQPNVNRASIWFPSTGTYMVSCRTTNACGIGNYVDLFVTVGRGGSSSAANIYPVPVSEALYIELDPPSSSKTQITFDVRLLDVQGNLLRQTFTKGGTVEFNVSNLPDGVYYLHIYDGVSEKPEMHQIMVEH